MKEKVYEITEKYCEVLAKLCNENHDSAFHFYMNFTKKLSGVFDLFASYNDISVEEYINMYNECRDKLDDVYNEYGK